MAQHTHQTHEQFNREKSKAEETALSKKEIISTTFQNKIGGVNHKQISKPKQFVGFIKGCKNNSILPLCHFCIL